jgi:23S rRNA (guanosine2251-2'-O)-methyltransferase
MIFEGAISAKAILSNKHRQINKLYIRIGKDDRNTRYIVQLAEKRTIEIEYVEESVINEMASGFTHGGILLDAGNREYNELSELLVKDNFIAIIDGIEDPYNLGYAMRSLYAFGCTGFVISNRRLTEVESNILKSSAGAYEDLKIVKSDDLIEDIKYIKGRNIKLYAMQRSDEATGLDEVVFQKNMAFIVGGEKRGISKEVLKLADELIYIPYANNFRNALNSSSAITCIGFMKYLQNNEKLM